MAEYCNDNFLMVEDNDNSFRMWQGLVGPHYTPILSNDGTLRWTNDGFLQNPDEVNIRGPQGAGLSIGGIRETEGELPATAPPGVIWLVGTEVPYEGYSYIGGEWVDLGPLSVGPAGPPGPQGDDYTLTEADKAEIADAAETVLLNELANNPLPLSRGGTGSQTLAGAQEILGITDLADQIGDTPLATEAQDIRGAINELVGDLGSLDFDTEAQNVTGAVNELAGDKVSKAGDTMTGNLILKSAKRETGVIPSAESNDPRIYFRDKNGYNDAWVSMQATTSGFKGLLLFARQRISEADCLNFLRIGVDSSGNAVVYVSNANAWRTALGLGTNGAFPITIAQGGSGQTAVTSETAMSNVLSAASNITISSFTYRQWGKVASLRFTCTCSSAITASAWTTLATIVSGKRPAAELAGLLLQPCVVANVDFQAGGAVNIRGAIAANTTINVSCTYILA